MKCILLLAGLVCYAGAAVIYDFPVLEYDGQVYVPLSRVARSPDQRRYSPQQHKRNNRYQNQPLRGGTNFQNNGAKAGALSGGSGRGNSQSTANAQTQTFSGNGFTGSSSSASSSSSSSSFGGVRRGSSGNTHSNSQAQAQA